MGTGGAGVRTAAKVAGIGLVNAGARGGISSVTHPAELSVRNASRPVSSVISRIGKADVATAVQRSSSRENAGREEELLLDGGKQMPRVVFGGPPNRQEAEEATGELKDALEKLSLSSPTHQGTDGSFELGQSSGLSLPSNSDHLETNSCIIAEPPNYAMKAFQLLSRSPAAQNVVASIASDSNVWDAVWKNDVLTEFIQTYKTSVDFEDQRSRSKITEVPDNESQDETGKSKNGFGEFFENIKQTVVQMVSQVTSYLQNIFGASSAENTSAASDAGFSYTDKTLAASFMALAWMVIMVVVLKRV